MFQMGKKKRQPNGDFYKLLSVKLCQPDYNRQS